jgi:RNA polymerase sigma-70 factor (ECF subfamily)
VEGGASEPERQYAQSSGPWASRSDRDVRLRRAFAECSDIVWRVLRLRLPPGDAQDAVQDVFITFDRKMASIPAGAERAWLVQTALWVASNVRRMNGHRRQREEASLCHQDHGDACPDPERLLGQKQARALLDRVLERMTYPQRVVFVLFELEQMKEAEIARALGIPRGTVASRLDGARQCFVRTLRALKAQSHGQEVHK